jgi:hypothetical protein
MTINNALDHILELKSELRKARKNLDELHNLSDELLSIKIDLGGRTELSDEMLIKVETILDKHKKVN